MDFRLSSGTAGSDACVAKSRFAIEMSSRNVSEAWITNIWKSKVVVCRKAKNDDTVSEIKQTNAPFNLKVSFLALYNILIGKTDVDSLADSIFATISVFTLPLFAFSEELNSFSMIIDDCWELNSEEMLSTARARLELLALDSSRCEEEIATLGDLHSV